MASEVLVRPRYFADDTRQVLQNDRKRCRAISIFPLIFPLLRASGKHFRAACRLQTIHARIVCHNMDCNDGKDCHRSPSCCRCPMDTGRNYKRQTRPNASTSIEWFAMSARRGERI